MTTLDKVLAIDFGSTKIVSAYYDIANGRSKIIIDSHSNRALRSCIAFTKTQCLFGYAAECQINSNARNTIRGRDLKLFSYKKVFERFSPLQLASKSMILVEYLEKEIPVHSEQLFALLLSKVKQESEKTLQKHFDKCIITIPSCYNCIQRTMMQDAAIISGFEAVQLISDTTAAAITYACEKNILKKEHNILMVDIGATYCQAAIIHIENKSVVVKACAGKEKLGGDDFVCVLMEYFIREYHKSTGVDLTKNQSCLTRLRFGCEELKLMLSTTEHAKLTIESFQNGYPYHLEMKRSQFENLSLGLFNDIDNLIKEVFKRTSVGKDQVEKVVLVGGGTRIPKIQQSLIQYFNGAPLCRILNQDEAIATGAAYFIAGRLNTKEILKHESSFKFNSKLNVNEMRKFLVDVEESDTATIKLISAMNTLEGFCYQLKREIKQCEHLSKNKQQMVTEKCDDILSWIKQTKITSENLNLIYLKQNELEELKSSFLKTDFKRESIKNSYSSIKSGVPQLPDESDLSHLELYDESISLFNNQEYENCAKILGTLIRHSDQHNLDCDKLLNLRAECYFHMEKYQLCLNDLKKIKPTESSIETLNKAEKILYEKAAKIALGESRLHFSNEDNVSKSNVLTYLSNALSTRPQLKNIDNDRITSQLLHERSLIYFKLKKYNEAINDTFQNMQIIHHQHKLKCQRDDMYKTINEQLETNNWIKSSFSENDITYKLRFIEKCLKESGHKRSSCTII